MSDEQTRLVIRGAIDIGGMLLTAFILWIFFGPRKGDT